MRGTVTLAAPALPTVFPFRDLILTTAFGVTLGTLVLQGLTLRPLLLRLRLEDDGSVDCEVRLAWVETLRSAVAGAATSPGAAEAAYVRHRYALQLRRRRDQGRRLPARGGGARLDGARLGAGRPLGTGGPEKAVTTGRWRACREPRPVLTPRCRTVTPVLDRPESARPLCSGRLDPE
jgi:hypothetical protein